MWFTRAQFTLCDELRMWGLEPRFEPGDVIARGFADLGFEEFQVLPGSQMLSLTAGSLSRIPDDHKGHFFWIPSVDEGIAWLEAQGAVVQQCQREDARTWTLSLLTQDGAAVETQGESLHETVLRALLEVLKGSRA
jgi:hypothetical protein